MTGFSRVLPTRALFKTQTDLMQSTPTRPSHHANAARSLFQNSWTQTTVELSPSSTLSLPENYVSGESDVSSTPDGASASALPLSPVTVLDLPSLPLPAAMRFPSTARVVCTSGTAARSILILYIHRTCPCARTSSASLTHQSRRA